MGPYAVRGWDQDGEERYVVSARTKREAMLTQSAMLRSGAASATIYDGTDDVVSDRTRRRAREHTREA